MRRRSVLAGGASTTSIRGRWAGRRHPRHAGSLHIRKRIEEAVGWARTVAGLRKARHSGLPKIDWLFTGVMSASNLVRLLKLSAVSA